MYKYVTSKYLTSGAITCSMVVAIRAPSCPMKTSSVELGLATVGPRDKIKFDNRGIVL